MRTSRCYGPGDDPTSTYESPGFRGGYGPRGLDRELDIRDAPVARGSGVVGRIWGPRRKLLLEVTYWTARWAPVATPSVRRADRGPAHPPRRPHRRGTRRRRVLVSRWLGTSAAAPLRSRAGPDRRAGPPLRPTGADLTEDGDLPAGSGTLHRTRRPVSVVLSPISPRSLSVRGRDLVGLRKMIITGSR